MVPRTAGSLACLLTIVAASAGCSAGGESLPPRRAAPAVHKPAALDATAEADRAAAENARVQLQYATIIAPISGRTGKLMVHVGNLVRANDTAPLVVINQVSPIYVSFGIPETDLANFKKYMAAGTLRVQPPAPGDAGEPPTAHASLVHNAVARTAG